jgi:hypothetical protein
MGAVMTERHTTKDDRRETRSYEIRLAGLTLIDETDGTTVIRGAVADQAALHGLLQRVRDLGLPLVSVTRDETDELTRLGTGPATAAAAVEPGLSASTASTTGRVR